MASSTYNQQILATVAAASINGNGTSPLAFGCSITRVTDGVYKVILPTGEAQSNDASFTHVQGKVGASPTANGLMSAVSDESDYIKTIVTTAALHLAGTVATDVSIEVVIERTTINL